MIYELLEADEAKDLERKINEKLADGWDLHGGLITAIKPADSEVRSGSSMAFAVKGKIMFYQAVIKN